MSTSNRGPRQKNKAQRAQFAKHTINIIIPQLLKYNAVAQGGIKKTELIRYVPSSSTSQLSTAPSASIEATTPHSHPKVTVLKADTFFAAQTLIAKRAPGTQVAVLNMCSVYQPGGGVLNGARAQEESLCVRSTLYASLNPAFYRLPADTAIFSPNVLVFRDKDNEDLPTAEQFFVDVISVAAVRGPEVKHGRYVEDRDREAMRVKIKLILQVARMKGVKVLVLGALGCGAYGNPTREVADLFRRVIIGNGSKKGENLDEIKEIVFAIFDEGENLNVFREVFSTEKQETKNERVEAKEQDQHK